MQILPATAKSEFGASAGTLWDPASNVRLGLRLTRPVFADRYDGDWELALSHFRGGELPRESNGRYRAHDYTRAYVEQVMRCWRRYQRDRDGAGTWIREARGESRFVADDNSFRFGPLDCLTKAGDPPTGGTRGTLRASAHYRYRGHDRLAEGL